MLLRRVLFFRGFKPTTYIKCPPSGAPFSSAPPKEAWVHPSVGGPVLSLTLPGGAPCRLPLPPMLTTVGDLLRDVTLRDTSVRTAALLKGGHRVSSCTFMETVLNQDFQLVLNDHVYNVRAFTPGPSHEHVQNVDDLKHVIHLLHSALSLPEQLQVTQRHLQARHAQLQLELQPLITVRDQVAKEAEFRANMLGWAGLAYLSLQGGFLGYLTWYVFAWDIMEPVTFFISCTTSMIFFGYYVLTGQDFACPQVRGRHFLHSFHRRASVHGFDVSRFNALTLELAQVNSDLRRLQSATRLRLPVDHLQPRRTA